MDWTTEELANLRDSWTKRRADVTARQFSQEYAATIDSARSPDSIREWMTYTAP